MKHCGNLNCPGRARDGVVPEYRDEVARCLDCDEPLSFGLAPDRVVDDPGLEFVEWKTVFIAPNAGIGRLVGNAIEEEGIPVYVKGEALQGAIGELPATVSQVEVQAPVERFEEAREIALWFEGQGSILPGREF
ncbi:MAG: DUF2007 domain-containing protein [Myxococcota bacterium]